jgi:hypothetical protein
MSISKYTAIECAIALDGYMSKRARIEGAGYDLDVNFYIKSIEAGIRKFYGVSIDGEGRLIHDDQEPEPGFLADYNRMEWAEMVQSNADSRRLGEWSRENRTAEEVRTEVHRLSAARWERTRVMRDYLRGQAARLRVQKRRAASKVKAKAAE